MKPQTAVKLSVSPTTPNQERPLLALSGPLDDLAGCLKINSNRTSLSNSDNPWIRIHSLPQYGEPTRGASATQSCSDFAAFAGSRSLAASTPVHSPSSKVRTT